MNSAAGASNVVVSTSSSAKSKKKAISPTQPVDLEELVGSTQEKRNWRGIVIALLVIVTVLALIVTAIILVTPKSTDETERKKMDFKAFMRNEYEPKHFHIKWIPGKDAFLFRDKDGSVIEYNCEDNETYPIMDNSTFRSLNTDSYVLSPDRKFALFIHDIIPIFRYTTIARYEIYNLETKKTFTLLGPSLDIMDDMFQYVTWTPTGHSLICVQYNDIFYLKDPIDNNSLHYQRITFDGEPEAIYNGIPDWVYEEEILHSNNALWPSPGSRFIVYASIDDRGVRTSEMSLFGPMTEIYVSSHQIKYPKPGTENPTVTLLAFDLQTNKSVTLEPPSEFKKKDHYFTTVSWQDETHVHIVWLNRPQNTSLFCICDVITGSCRKNHRVEAEGGWLDLLVPAIFTPDNMSYFMLLPHKDGAAGSFQHIALIDTRDNLLAKPGDGTKIFITDGRRDVMEIVGYNDEKKLIYFIATKQNDPRGRHLYSATTQKDHHEFRKSRCLSCHLGDGCQYVSAEFSQSGRFYMLVCKGPDVPSYHLFTTEIEEGGEEEEEYVHTGLLHTFEDNHELRERINDIQLPIVEYVQIPLEDDESELMWAKLLLPTILKKEEIITYNVLLKVYGGPGSQMVTEEFVITWEHYLSSVHGIIIAYVDARGTAGRGNKWQHAVYKKLGTLEVEDTITAAKYIKNLHYVHDDTMIWGLSYGGFLTASVLARGEEAPFKCGISVAPVTDWRYYDSVYTERYMGMPTAQDNLGAYNFANISRYADNFRHTKFMIIHGTADDNVHFQNSAQLIKALTESDVYFTQQIYPDENHFLSGGNTRQHLFNSMEDFMLVCFGKTRHYNEDADKPDVKKDDEEVEDE